MIQIKKAETDEEIAALALLAKKIWNAYFIDLISQKQIDFMVEKFQSYKAIRKAIYEEGYLYYLAYENSILVGYCGIVLKKQKLFISKLYVDEYYRGKGIGRLLMEQAEAYAIENQCRSIYLTCNKHNQTSLSIYDKMGFKSIDSVTTDIGNGFVMDDYILQLDFEEKA